MPTGRFGDIDASVHRANIDCIAWYLITLGADNSSQTGARYAPQAFVTRAQMASFIARLAVEGGITLPANPPDRFDDDNADVHEPNINALAELDIIQGTGDRAFSPQRRVTRAQMATFIANVHRKVVGATRTPARDHFSDDDGNVHEPNINTLAELGVVVGTGRGRYQPAGMVTRAQMASFIANDLRLLVNADRAYAGGADVLLAPRSDSNRSVPGQVRSHKRLTQLVANGCSLHDTTIAVADDGRFTVTIPATQPNGDCTITLTAHTTGPRTTQQQTVAHTFTVTTR